MKALGQEAELNLDPKRDAGDPISQGLTRRLDWQVDSVRRARKGWAQSPFESRLTHRTQFSPS